MQHYHRCSDIHALLPLWVVSATVLYSLLSMQVSGFPTIMFVSGKDGAVLSYDGSREKDDLIKFINDHSSRVSASSVSKVEL